MTPLALEVRTAIDTKTAAFHLNRRPQTLRAWASSEKGPVRPIRIGGRLAWPVEEIRALLVASRPQQSAQRLSLNARHPGRHGSYELCNHGQ